MQTQAKEDKIQFQIVDNQLTPEDFIRLKVATGFMDRSLEQVKLLSCRNIRDRVSAEELLEIER